MNRRKFSQLAFGAAVASTLPRGFAQASPGNTPRLSVMIWALTKAMSFDQAVDVVAAAGYQGIELTGQFQKWSPDELRQKVAKIHGAGLIVDSMSGVANGLRRPQRVCSFHDPVCRAYRLRQTA